MGYGYGTIFESVFVINRVYMKLYRTILLLSGSLWLTLTSVGQTRHTLTLKPVADFDKCWANPTYIDIETVD